MRPAAALALLLLGCGTVPPPSPAAAPVRTARLPQRAELACFPCHSQLQFEEGPKFPHALTAHRRAGHCHLCHLGSGHHGREIDRGACLTCHEEGSRPLAHLARSDARIR